MEVKIACISNGLHALLIFSLIPLMYGRSTLVFGRHSETHFAFFSAPLQLLNWGSHSPSGHSGHGSFPLPGQNPVCKFVQLCCGGSLLHQTSLSGSGVRCSGGSGLCRWASCKHLWSLPHMDAEDRNGSFRLFLLGEVDLCAKASMGLALLSVPCTRGPAFRYWL